MSGLVTPESLHAQNEDRCPECNRMAPGHSIKCKAGNERAKKYQKGMRVRVLESICAENEALRLENERLTRALEQARQNTAINLPNAHERKRPGYTEASVMFVSHGFSYMRECPDLAAYLRAKTNK